MPARRDTRMTYSYLAGRDVGLSSGEWQHECEIAYLAAMPLAKRNDFLDGVPGTTDRDGRGIKGHRGEAAVARLREEIDRYGRLVKPN